MDDPSLLNSPSPSTTARNPHKRIKLTIKPKQVPQTEHRDDGVPPDTQTPKVKTIKLKLPSSGLGLASSSNEQKEEKTLPKIKFRPWRPKVEDHLPPLDEPEPSPEPMDVDMDAHVQQPSAGSSTALPMNEDPQTPVSAAREKSQQQYEPFFQPPPTPATQRAAPPPKPKIPRPVKLKPLREVLTKLIAQIKKHVSSLLLYLHDIDFRRRKDDYAFFLQPVDTTQVPNYADIVKNPMDFGTMTEKVEKGKYRSLEQFKVRPCSHYLVFFSSD